MLAPPTPPHQADPYTPLDLLLALACVSSDTDSRVRRGVGAAPTLTLLKSSCMFSVYICSVRSILWAPSLQCFTSCGVEFNRDGLIHRALPLRPTQGLSCQRSCLTLLMAFRAWLAALYRSGWPCVFRQSVWRREELGSTRVPPRRAYVGQNLKV